MAQELQMCSRLSQSIRTRVIFLVTCQEEYLYHFPLRQGNTMTLACKVGDPHEESESESEKAVLWKGDFWDFVSTLFGKYGSTN